MIAHTRRPDKADNLALNGSSEFANGDEFQDAILDVLKSVVVGIENSHRVRNRIVLG